jgi:hypothetical protein
VAPWVEALEPQITHGRSFRAIADAFEEAADEAATYAELVRALTNRRGEIDPQATELALQCIVVLACRKSGETPRTLLENAFVRSPSDEYWRAAIEGRT